MTSLFVNFGNNQIPPSGGDTWGITVYYLSWDGTAWWSNPADNHDII